MAPRGKKTPTSAELPGESYSSVMDANPERRSEAAAPSVGVELELDARDRILETLEREREYLADDRESLKEALTSALQMLRQEDVGWAVPGSEHTYGLSLADLKKWSSEIRTAYTGTRERAANPHIRNGFMLRQSYIWMGSIKYRGENETSRQGKRGLDSYRDDVQNRRMFFDASARRRRELALFADGIYLAVGDDKTKRLRSVPLNEITDTHRDDVFADDIVAYRWTRQEVEPDSNPRRREPKSYWVFVDWYDKALIPDKIRYGGEDEPVLKDHTAFDIIANRPDGYAFGSPDAIAAIVWARVIRDLIMNGVKMQDALAMFAFKVNAESAKGQSNAAAAIAGAEGAANTATMAKDTTLVPLSSAGRGYDFDSIRFVVSTMAASLHVSGIALAADTAFAGSSYGAAQTLDLPTQLAMQSRREEHIEMDRRVLKWLGHGSTEVYFDPYDDATAEYRQVQAAMLAWSSGTLSAEEFRGLLEDIFGHEFSTPIPKGVMVPNNKASLARSDVDADSAGAPGDGPSGKVAKQKSPDQGKSTGAGDAEMR